MKISHIALATLLLSPSLAFAATWQIDSSHSSARFKVRHMVVSWTHGTMGPVTGTMTFDKKNPAATKVEATIDVKAIDTDDAKRDEHLRGADFFDVGKFPTISFKSKKVKKAGQGKLKLVGDLTIKGITKEITLDVEGPSAVVLGPWGNLRTGINATTTIDRRKFNVTYGKVMDNGGLVVGDDVKIELDIEFTSKPPKKS